MRRGFHKVCSITFLSLFPSFAFESKVSNRNREREKKKWREKKEIERERKERDLEVMKNWETEENDLNGKRKPSIHFSMKDYSFQIFFSFLTSFFLSLSFLLYFLFTISLILFLHPFP